jgi:hypothetical protein
VRTSGRDSAFVVGGLLILAVASVGLKAIAGANNQARPAPGRVEQELLKTLQAQGFSTSLRPGKFQSPIVSGVRKACRISARDATAGTSAMIVYTRAAQNIGPVRYLYRGKTFETPPMVRMRIGKYEDEFLSRLGFRAPLHVPIAVATSRECGGESFGLSDLRIDD